MVTKKAFTLLELLIVIAILAVIAAVAIPSLVASQKAGNERSGMMSIKSMATSQSDFRNNDRDGNQVADYWTGDVSGLYRLTIAGEPIKLIEWGVAQMDGAPLAAGDAGGAMGASVTPESTKAGYWCQILDTDLNDGADYQQTTDGTMGAVHHRQKFGYIAYPDSFNNSGNQAFIINEMNTIWRINLAGEIAQQGVNPKPVDPAWTNYPVTPGANGWGKID